MEGVIVSAKKGIVTVSVVTNDKGEFSFPREQAWRRRLCAEHQGRRLRSRWRRQGHAAGQPKAMDLKLVKAKNIAPQLSNQEWIHSVPGSKDEKRILSRCVNCHTVERVISSKYTAPELVATMERMATYSNNSFFKKPQVRADGARHGALRAQRGQGRDLSRQHQSFHRRRGSGSRRRCRASPAAARASSSPNTICRVRKRSRMT